LVALPYAVVRSVAQLNRRMNDWSATVPTTVYTSRCSVMLALQSLG